MLSVNKDQIRNSMGKDQASKHKDLTYNNLQLRALHTTEATITKKAKSIKQE